MGWELFESIDRHEAQRHKLKDEEIEQIISETTSFDGLKEAITKNNISIHTFGTEIMPRELIDMVSRVQKEKKPISFQVPSKHGFSSKLNALLIKTYGLEFMAEQAKKARDNLNMKER